MIIESMARFIRQHDWSAVVVEIIVVIVGLMLAFQLDRWWEQRGERAQEAQYVERLIADVQTDIDGLEFAVELQTIRLEMAELLMAVVVDPEEASRRPVEFLGAVLQSSYLYTPIPTSHTFDDLQSTGNSRRSGFNGSFGTWSSRRASSVTSSKPTFRTPGCTLGQRISRKSGVPRWIQMRWNSQLRDSWKDKI